MPPVPILIDDRNAAAMAALLKATRQMRDLWPVEPKPADVAAEPIAEAA